MSDVSNFVDDILKLAVEKNASDIHFELFNDIFFIKFRINGELITIETLNKHIADKISSKIKILASINIAEKRFPQDGCIHKCIDGINIEFRVSTVPIIDGESIVLRVLNSKKNLEMTQKQLFSDKNFTMLLDHVVNFNGLNVIAGATGSGKTTTLYTILSHLNSDKVKIVTCEDPVEYELENVSQSQVNSSVCFGFAEALRAFLRHDPDIILIGEIRDKETAELAIRSALTGHKVFATIHANGVSGVVPRFIDLGIDADILSEALSTITAQHLVKIQDNFGQTIGRQAEFDILLIDELFRKKIRTQT